MNDQVKDEKKDRTTKQNLLGLAAIAGGIFAGRDASAPGSSTNLGYQGEIPDYSLVREQVLDTYDADRTPGSRGQRYFSDARYVPTTSPDITGIRQTLFNQANVGPDSLRAANYARMGKELPDLAGRGPTGIDSVMGAPLSYADRGLPAVPAKTYTAEDVTDPTQTQYFPDGTMYIPNYGFVNANDPASMAQLTAAGVEQRRLAKEAEEAAAAEEAARKAAEEAAGDSTTYTPDTYVDPDGDGKYQLVGEDGETLSEEYYNADGTAYSTSSGDGTTYKAGTYVDHNGDGIYQYVEDDGTLSGKYFNDQGAPYYGGSGEYVDPDGDGKYQKVGDDGTLSEEYYKSDGSAYTTDDGTITGDGTPAILDLSQYYPVDYDPDTYEGSLTDITVNDGTGEDQTIKVPLEYIPDTYRSTLDYILADTSATAVQRYNFLDTMMNPPTLVFNGPRLNSFLAVDAEGNYVTPINEDMQAVILSAGDGIQVQNIPIGAFSQDAKDILARIDTDYSDVKERAEVKFQYLNSGNSPFTTSDGSGTTDNGGNTQPANAFSLDNFSKYGYDPDTYEGTLTDISVNRGNNRANETARIPLDLLSTEYQNTINYLINDAVDIEDGFTADQQRFNFLNTMLNPPTLGFRENRIYSFLAQDADGNYVAYDPDNPGEMQAVILDNGSGMQVQNIPIGVFSQEAKDTLAQIDADYSDVKERAVAKLAYLNDGVYSSPNNSGTTGGTTYEAGAFVDPDGDGKYQKVGEDGETLSEEYYKEDGTAYPAPTTTTTSTTGAGNTTTIDPVTTKTVITDPSDEFANVTDRTQMQTFPDGTVYVPGYGIGDPSDPAVNEAINAWIESQIGGTSSIGFKNGGYLDGITDGMADNVPATIIENSQPAALSDGEFVVPADVVSHLGNGNSDAGAEQLYSMMEEVRRARTGSSKQGKEINPNEYLPLRGIA